MYYYSPIQAAFSAYPPNSSLKFTLAATSDPVSASPGKYFKYLTGHDPNAAKMATSDFRGKGFARYRATPSAPDTSLGKELFLHFGKGITPEINPRTGQPRTIPTQNGIHETGIDFVLSTPQWFTNLVATAPGTATREALLNLWDTHSDEMFNRVERDAKVCRPSSAKPSECTRTTKQKGSQTERVTAELIAFKARHYSSRPTDETIAVGRPPDPQMHTHFFIFNMAYAHGKWRSVDDDGLKRIMGKIALESEGELARLCEEVMGQRIDYTEQRNGSYRTSISQWEDTRDEKTGKTIMGLSSFWSSNKRREQQLIADYIKIHHRPPSDKWVRAEMRKSRHYKPLEPETVMDWEAVLTGAREAGYDLSYPTAQTISREPLEQRLDILRARIFGPQGVLGQADDSTFNTRHLVYAVARCSTGLGLTLSQQDDFREQILRECVLVEDRGADYKHLYTTKVNIWNENTIAQWLEHQDSQTHLTPTPEAIERAILRVEQEKGIQMSDSDKEMVRRACATSGLYILEGLAGSGKTTLLLCVVYAYADTQSTGRAISTESLTISTAKDTALRSGKKLSSVHSDSIESFCKGVRSGRIKKSSQVRNLFVDEYAMVDNHRAAKLAKAAKTIGPINLILMGDRDQLQCIGAGGWAEDAARKYSVDTLETVYRQIHEIDVAMLFDLRSGKAAKVVKTLLNRDLVHISEDAPSRIGDAVAKMIELRESGQSVEDIKIVMDGRNIDLDLGNACYQQWRLSKGELKGDPIHVRHLKANREWDLYIGDEISFIESYWDPERRLSISNGVQGRIVDRKGSQIKVESDRLKESVWIEATASVCPSYVVQATRMQGGQAKSVIVLPGCGTLTRQVGYSEMSRHVENVFLFLDRVTHGGKEGDIDPIEMITKRWKDSRKKFSASLKMRQVWACAQSKNTPDLPTTTPNMGSTRIPQRWEKRQRKFAVDKDGIGLELG